MIWGVEHPSIEMQIIYQPICIYIYIFLYYTSLYIHLAEQHEYSPGAPPPLDTPIQGNRACCKVKGDMLLTFKSLKQALLKLTFFSLQNLICGEPTILNVQY